MAEELRLFDIIGPIMIGPSSSHTAGAARIGRIVRALLRAPVSRAQIDFHGSFAGTWQGHGSDRAVVGGLLGLDVDDVRLRDSLRIAKERGLEVQFGTVSLKGAHPNTMRITAQGAAGERACVVASSVGGGMIRVAEIDGFSVTLTGEAHTLIVRHLDMPGVVADVSGTLARAGMNIAQMRVSRQRQGGGAIMILETDTPPSGEVLARLHALPRVESAVYIAKQ